MDVQVKFLGGAGTVTGSKYLLTIGNFRILVDCGLFQGIKELRLRNWDKFPVDPNTIDAIVLTHAHIDHTGYLPRLCQQGYNNPIYCTTATRDLMEIMLLDSAKLQVEEAEYARKKGYSAHKKPEPLYTTEDAEHVFKYVETANFNQTIQINDHIKLTFRIAGHILGASIVELDITGQRQNKKIVFSGDVGRYDQPIMPDPQQISYADVLFVESTYGNRVNPDEAVKAQLAEYISEAIEKSGCILIPAFSVGRTQMLIYYLKVLFEEQKIPDIPVFLDSPMAISVTSLYKKHTAYHKLGDAHLTGEKCVFDYKNMHYYTSQEASRSLNNIKNNAIIISASGMCSGGRILHHLYHRLPRENDTVLFVGYQAEGTRGRAILEKEPHVFIFGEQVNVNCNVRYINGLSAHADKLELHQWLSGFSEAPKMTFVVHGENLSANALAQWIDNELHWNTHVPDYLESFDLFQGI